jgi:copper chaperone NosL
MNHGTTARVILAAFLMFSSACAREPVWPPSPAELRAGEDSCAECRMFVSDPRFAAQRHSRDGLIEWFDDLGCLVDKYGSEDADPDGVFVHAFDGEGWVQADHGYVVHSSEILSPMGYGWCAFSTLEEAHAAAARYTDSETSLLLDLLRGGSTALPPMPSDSNSKTPQKK